MKKKKLFSLVAAIAILSSFMMVGCSSKEEAKEDAAPKEEVVIKAGTEGTMFPWTYMEGEKVVGLEADMAEEIGKRIGKKIELEPIEWSGLFGSLDSNRIDTVANIVTVNDERKEKYEFSETYIYNPMVLATKSDSDIDSLEDLDGKSIVVEAGSSDEQVVADLEKKLGIKMEHVYYEGISIQDVVNGRVDLWIGGKPSINVQIKEGYDLKIIGETGDYQEYAYPFVKGEEGSKLAEEFNKALNEMREDGTLSKISEKWLEMDVTKKPEK